MLQMASYVVHRPLGCIANVVARSLKLTSRVARPGLKLLTELLTDIASYFDKLVAAARKLLVGGPDAFLDAIADGVARFRDGHLGAIQH